MVKMTKYDLKPIVKTYYDALEEGTILGRKCTDADISSFLLICAVTSAEVWIPSGWI